MNDYEKNVLAEKQQKMAYENPNLLVVEFQTKFHFKFGSMIWYMLNPKPFWGLKVRFFSQNFSFIIVHFIRKCNKLRRTCSTLRNAHKIFFLFISWLSMSKQPEKPWAAWLFKLFVIFTHSSQSPFLVNLVSPKNLTTYTK